jgi:single-stranded DNA-specific DHH superfamily exonuclease
MLKTPRYLRRKWPRSNSPAENIHKFADASKLRSNLFSRKRVTLQSTRKPLSEPITKEFEINLGLFGQGNPEPLFATKAVRLCSPPRRVGTNADHLQLAVTDHTNSIRCIGFRMGPLEKKLLETDCSILLITPQSIRSTATAQSSL